MRNLYCSSDDNSNLINSYLAKNNSKKDVSDKYSFIFELVSKDCIFDEFYKGQSLILKPGVPYCADFFYYMNGRYVIGMTFVNEEDNAGVKMNFKMSKADWKRNIRIVSGRWNVFRYYILSILVRVVVFHNPIWEYAMNFNSNKKR
jgi:hypothetical protein